MFRLIVVCFLLAAFSLTGCGGKEQPPEEVKVNRNMETIKKLLPKN